MRGVIQVQGAGFRVQGSGCRVQGAGCRVQSAGRRSQGAGLRVQGTRDTSITQDVGLQGAGFRVQGKRDTSVTQDASAGRDEKPPGKSCVSICPENTFKCQSSLRIYPKLSLQAQLEAPSDLMWKH